MKKLTVFILALVIIFQVHMLRADEGMWIPLLLESLNESEMQAMGMKMTAEDIYSVNQGSLKDGIAHLGDFCTSEVVSPTGLLLTNHHCGYGAIRSHSSVERNYLKNGFWAMGHNEELPNPDLFARFIVRIEDITKKAVKGVKKKHSLQEKQSIIDKNLNSIKENAEKEDYQEVSIRPFFKGNQYFLFVTETYQDVRLVAAPPESIGKFGADSDNWVWPRHTGDFSVFRIYADKHNKPAEYAPENVPFKPKHFFPISLDGVAIDDFTLVFGFPGTTNQYLPGVAVQQIMDVLDPAKIGIRDISLGIMDKYMRADEATRLQYASKFAGTANSWKKWIGEARGLKKTNAIGKKKKLEAEFMRRVSSKKKWSDAYAHLLPSFEKLYAENEPYALALNYYNEVFTINVEVFQIASRVNRILNTYQNQGKQGYDREKENLINYLEGFHKDYQAEIDQEILQALIHLIRKNLPPEHLAPPLRSEEMFMRGYKDNTIGKSLFDGSILDELDALVKVLEEGPDALEKKIMIDALFYMYGGVINFTNNSIAPKYTEFNDQINSHMTAYMEALIEVFPKKKFWPDANSTLRVSYGQVAGYEPKDAVIYKHVTYLDGVMEKYVPGDYEFDVHPKLISLFEAKDFGPYGENGKMSVCFIGTNHTTGGNSGSPAIDAHGNLIGINFDRAWEGTMSDLIYDSSICRNIMVDIRYVLFVMDKLGGAGHLVDEMTLVHPKK
jgi:hypothetical protein